MRNPGLLILTTLAACAAAPPPGVDPEWRLIQSARLERLHGPRDPAAAVAALLTQDPQPATARRDGRHLDQREPVGMRRFREPRSGWVATATLGLGAVNARASGTLLDDRADATFLRLGLDSDTGAAARADVWSSDTELFSGRRINDGVLPANADASLKGVDLFPHLRFDGVRHGSFSMPVRLGLFGEWQRLTHEKASVEREWISLGPRLVLEPTLRLIGDDSGWLEAFGSVGGEVGPTWFSEDFRGGDDRDATTRWGVEFSLGLRGHVGRMQAELGYGLHNSTIGETDTALFGDRSKTELERQQFFFGLGLKF